MRAADAIRQMPGFEEAPASWRGAPAGEAAAMARHEHWRRYAEGHDEKNVSHPGEGRYSVELHPTYRALIDTMHHVGFRNLVELVAVSGRVSGLYRDHVRRCIIGFK